MSGGVGSPSLYENHDISYQHIPCWTNLEPQVYLVASFFLYTLFLISIIDTKPSPTTAHYATWIVALAVEVVLFGSSLAIYTSKHREPTADGTRDGQIRQGITTWETIEILINLLRILLLLALMIFYTLFSLLRWSKERSSRNGIAEEGTGLLNGHGAENGTANGYGYGSTHSIQPQEEAKGWERPNKIPTKSWWEYIRGYSIFFPYLWPAKSLKLQITVLICFVLVLIQRVVNVLVPLQAGAIINTLSKEDGIDQGKVWGQILLYILYRLLQGSNGLVGAIRSILWLPISQYSYREISTASFEHVHSLSLDFHLGKKTGEVLSALSKGSSINTFLEQVTFQVFPMLIDLGVAIGYFLIGWDPYYALVVTIVTCLYLYLTIRLAQWRADIRRTMVNLDRREEAVK